MNIVWSAESRRALRAIRKFIAQDSEFYAARMALRIIERVEHAALSPAQGHAVHEYPEEPLKEVHESPYRIIYAFSATELQVVTHRAFQTAALHEAIEAALRRFVVVPSAV